MVPLSKKVDQRVFSNYRGIKLLSFPGKVYARVLKRKSLLISQTSHSEGAMWLLSRSAGPVLYPLEDISGRVGVLPKQSTCVLWICTFNCIPQRVLWECLGSMRYQAPCSLVRHWSEMSATSQTLAQLVLDCPFSLGGFLIIMARISRQR